MRLYKKLLQLAARIFIAFMFAVCVVLGVVPVIPKRKEQYDNEIKMDNKEIITHNATDFRIVNKK